MSEEKNTTEQFQGEKIDWKKYFSHNNIVKNTPFLFFLSLVAILYIYNGHLADKLARKISNSEKNVKDLEYEYKTIKSEVIYRSKSSEMIKAVEPMGLKEVTSPPILLNDSVTTTN